MVEGSSGKTKGYIIQVKEEKPAENGKVEFFFRNIEFHPYLFTQFKNFENAQFESFMEAVDEFYSTQESQKIDMKTLHQEREALKKLSNVKNDHAKRLEELTKVQDVDRKRQSLSRPIKVWWIMRFEPFSPPLPVNCPGRISMSW